VVAATTPFQGGLLDPLALLFSAALNGLAFTLLAFGAHSPTQSIAAAPTEIAGAQMSSVLGRAAQVRSFVDAYRKRHGRE
jgi:hypothetical protein